MLNFEKKLCLIEPFLHVTIHFTFLFRTSTVTEPLNNHTCFTINLSLPYARGPFQLSPAPLAGPSTTWESAASFRGVGATSTSPSQHVLTTTERQPKPLPRRLPGCQGRGTRFCLLGLNPLLHNVKHFRNKGENHWSESQSMIRFRMYTRRLMRHRAYTVLTAREAVLNIVPVLYCHHLL